MVVVLAGILALVLATSFPHPSVPMPPPTPIRSAAAAAKNGTESLQTLGGSEPLASAAHALVRAVLRDASRNGSAVESNMSHSAAKELPLPLVSIYSPFNDRFVCVDAKGEARAEAEYPWSPTCWFRAQRVVTAALAGGAAHAATVVSSAAVEAVADPEARLHARLGSTWVMLRAQRNGKLLAFHHATDGGGKAWTVRADVHPSSAHEAHWRWDGVTLRNRASGGFLNVRPGGRLRGHGNKGPPWRVADRKDDASVQIGLRVVPADLVAASAGNASAPYTVLSVDYHIATAQDVGHTLRELGLEFVDRSLSGACARRGTCATPSELPVLTKDVAFTLCPNPHSTRRAAFEALRTSALLKGADAILCAHPAALCEAWLPFNKSLLVLVTTNLEFARENAPRWRAWLRTLTKMVAAPRTVLASNNRYDQAYVEHFLGVRPFYLPSMANYVTARYAPGAGQPVLFWRAHHKLARLLIADVRRADGNLRVASVEELYPGGAAGGGYTFAQLVTHPAVVVVPYTKSTMSFFELYRMALPLFFPSSALLARWERQQHVLSERVYWRFANSPLRRPPTPNPNSLQDANAVDHWVRLSDQYVYPHVQYFSSAYDLARKLKTTDFRAVSRAMSSHAREMQPLMRGKWQAVLRTLFGGAPPGSWPSDDEPGGFDRALRDRFGLTLERDEPPCRRDSAPELGRWAR